MILKVKNLRCRVRCGTFTADCGHGGVGREEGA